jgi:hypothetical protein
LGTAKASHERALIDAPADIAKVDSIIRSRQSGRLLCADIVEKVA